MSNDIDVEKSSKIKAIYLADSDLKVAGSLIYQAYRNDSVFQDIFQSELQGYEERLRSAIREELKNFLRAEQPMIGLFDGERLVAVACMNSSEAAFGGGRYWHWKFKMLLTAGFVGTKQLLEKEQKILENVPVEHFHILSFIAVHPGERGLGLPTMLLSAVESAMLEDENSQGIAVFRTLDRNKKLFESCGYRPLKEMEVGNIKGMLMFRDRVER